VRVVSENEGRRGEGSELSAQVSVCAGWLGRHVVVMHRTDGKTSASQMRRNICFFFLVRFWVFGVESQRAGRSSKIISKNEA